MLIYKFHYNYSKNKYGVNSGLLFTDTDSSMYEIKTEDVYEDFSEYAEIFDFGNFSSKLKYDHSSKLIVGEMKDEISGAAIKEFVGLKQRFIHSW